MDAEKDKAALGFQSFLIKILHDSFVPREDGGSPWNEYVDETGAWIKQNSPGLWEMMQKQSAVAANAIIDKIDQGDVDVRDIYAELVNSCVVAVTALRFKLEKEHGTFTGSEQEEDDL